MPNGKKFGAALVVVGILVSVIGVLPASAAPPELNIPERVYGLVNQPVLFTGTDAISGDTRLITVDLLADEDPDDGDGVCDTSASTYAIGGCPRVQITANGAQGELSLFPVTNLTGAGVPDGVAQGGAIFESGNADGSGATIALNGTTTQLNDALATLRWTPVTDYENDDENASIVTFLARNDTDADSVTKDIQIRIDGVNEGPTLTVPGTQSVAAGSDTLLPDPFPPATTPSTPGLFDITDPDIEEGDPSVALLIVFATCGEFSLRGQGPSIQGPLEDVLADYVDSVSGQNDQTDPVYLAERDGIVAGVIAALPSEVTSASIETNDADDDNTGWAGIGALDDLVYLLSGFTFHAPAAPASCEVWTIVSDLGNDGLPLTYVGSPIGGIDGPQPGLEIPEPIETIDFDTTTFIVEGGTEVSVPAALTVAEGAAISIPVAVSTADHPALDVALTTGGGTASGADYSAATTPVHFDQGAGASVNSSLQSTQDVDPEDPDETVQVTIDPTSLPEGVTVAPGEGTVTITILDDGDVVDPPDDTTDPSVTINQAGAQPDPTSISPIVFDVVFDEPVTGLTPDDIDLTSSTAGGTLVADIDGSGTTYTASISGMTTPGDVIAAVTAGAAQDAAANPSNASTTDDDTVAWEVADPEDNIKPSVTINQAGAQPDPTGVAPIFFSVLFDEPVTGLADDDIDFTGSTTGGGALTALISDSGDADAATYTVAVGGMTTAGNVVAAVAVDAASDAALNLSNPSTSTDNTVAWEVAPEDNTKPSVTINQGASQVDPTSTSPITFDILFDEPVTGLGTDDIDLTSSTAGGPLTVASLSGSGTTYTVTIDGMTTPGNVIATVAVDAASDAALNLSNPSTSTDNTVEWEVAPEDNTKPSVTINQGASQVDPTSTSPITFDIVFDEPVTGLGTDDIDLTSSTAGGPLTVASLSGSGTTYTVTIDGMTTPGDVIATVAVDAASDAALNLSNPSTSTDNTVEWQEEPDTTTTTEDPGGTTTTTENPGGTTSTTDPASVGGAGQGQGGASLPLTGIDLTWPLLVGLGLITIGATDLVIARRRRLRLD